MLTKTLEELFKPLNRSMREYLILRIMGEGVVASIKFLGIADSSVGVWRTLDGSPYKEVEREVLAHAEELRGQAVKMFVSDLSTKSLYILSTLVSLGIGDFTKQSSSTQRSILRAVELLNKVSHIPALVAPAESYEVRLLKARGLSAAESGILNKGEI
jgi:hypothetical protein